ncbi:MAG: phosphoglycolate phosphatase [Thermoplasmata archaeon]|nr:phosphoglycolate phosphatase [Thermoplasmata archaeon]
MKGARARDPASPEVRALVTDVDGTLTDEHRQLDVGAIEALRQLRDRGWPVILATGNVLPIALAIHRSIGLKGPIVAENGGLIYETHHGLEHVTKLCRRSVALAAYRRARRSGLALRPLFSDRWRETEVAVEPSFPIARVRAAVADPRVTVEGTGFAIHFMEAGCGKVPALQRVLAPLGLSLADCLVAGDGDNDAAMLRAAGWAVSFRSGSARARGAADYVARASHARGFVEALKAKGVYDSDAGLRAAAC